MNVLLVSPARSYALGNEQYPSGALLLLGTMLRRAGHNIKIVHAVADHIGHNQFRQVLVEFSPQIVGFTVTTYQSKEAKKLSAIVKQYNPDILTVAGGPHPSALKETYLAEAPCIDIVSYGEGEQSLLSIANGDKDIKGICFREGERIVITPPTKLINELDSLPLVDSSLVDFRKFSGLFPVGRRPCMFVMSSRGCPYQCTFCSKSVYGNTLRLRSPENIIEEVGMYYRDWGVREIHFGDDTFNADLSWAHKLLGLMIAKGYSKKLVSRIALRVNAKILDADLLKHLKEAGVWFVYLGVENGNQKMLDRMHKGITIAEIKRAFKMIHDAGLRSEAFFIVGLPGETTKTIQDSWELYKEIKPWWGGFSKAMPFPGTSMTAEVIKNGHLLCTDYDNYNPSKMIVRTETLTAEELSNWTDKLNTMTRWGKVMKLKQSMYLAVDQARNVVQNRQWAKPGGSI